MLSDIIRDLQGLPTTITSPRSAATATAASTTSPLGQACRCFLEFIRRSKEHNDEWLSTDDVMRVINIFGDNDEAVNSFMNIANSSIECKEALMRMWVHDRLAQAT